MKEGDCQSLLCRWETRNINICTTAVVVIVSKPGVHVPRLLSNFNVKSQLHKPDAVVRAYREFVESFGDNFAPPPTRGGLRQIQQTREDLTQRKRSQNLSEVGSVLIDPGLESVDDAMREV